MKSAIATVQPAHPRPTIEWRRRGNEEIQSEKGKTTTSSSTGIFKSFTDSIKQSSKDETLRQDVKKFEEKLTELNENEAFKKTIQTISKVKEDVYKQNAAIISDVKEKADTVKKVVGSTISTAAKPIKDAAEVIKPYVPDISESEVVKKVGKTLDETEARILEKTNVYQYGGFKTKEQRDKSLSNQASTAENEFVKPNPDAGTSIVSQKESSWSKAWNDFVDNNRLLQRIHGIKRQYDESNNVFIYFAREITNSISDRVSSLFSESETARVYRELRLRDPTFSMEKFMKLTREYIIPEILEAYIAGDLPALRMWCTEGAFNLIKAHLETRLKPGYRSEGRVLDLRDVDLAKAAMQDESPVLLLTFHTQETHLIRQPDGLVVEGGEDAIQNVMYIIALTKEPRPADGSAFNSRTQGWKLLELAVRDRNGGW